MCDMVKIQSGSLEIHKAHIQLHLIISFNILIFWQMPFINTYNLFSHVFLPCFDSDVTLRVS